MSDRVVGGSVVAFGLVAVGSLTNVVSLLLDHPRQAPFVLIGLAIVLAGTGTLAAARRRPTAEEGREWVDAGLWGELDDAEQQTDVRRALIIERKVGKWTYIEVEVANVPRQGLVIGPVTGGQAEVECRFREAAHEDVLKLERGDTLVAVGRIAGFDGHAILDPCEFLNRWYRVAAPKDASPE